MRFYTASFTAVALTAQQDLISLLAGSNQAVILYELGLSQLTQLGNANEYEWSLLLKSGQTVAGSGGTTVAPVAIDFGDSAAGATARYNDTTIAGTGTIVTHYPWYWNVRGPFQYIWTPETRPIMRPARRCTFSLATTPAASTTCSGYIVFAEAG